MVGSDAGVRGSRRRCTGRARADERCRARSVADLVARVRRDADVLLGRVGNEVARRSGPEFGDTGLAKQQGFHNPSRLLAASTGASRGEASRLIAVGAAIADRQSFTGERHPSSHPYVAAAVEAAAISIEAASAITSMLDRVGARAETEVADVIEAALAELAADAPLELVMRAVREAEARLDQDGVEPREDQLRRDRSLTMRESGGMVHLHARLDPETAAPIKAAIEALVTDVLRGRAGDSAEGHAADGATCPGPVIDDDRTIPQLQADALAALARHTLGCSQTLTPLAKTTVIVRLNHDTLVEGLGHASIDGLDQPVSATTVRRMAADGELIPAMLGGRGIPLDLGRAARFFTKAQRLALGERERGAAEAVARTCRGAGGAPARRAGGSGCACPPTVRPGWRFAV